MKNMSIEHQLKLRHERKSMKIKRRFKIIVGGWEVKMLRMERARRVRARIRRRRRQVDRVGVGGGREGGQRAMPRPIVYLGVLEYNM